MQILIFLFGYLVKNACFCSFLVDYPLLPADMDNLLLYTGIIISFDLEKMGRTRGEPQAM